MNAGAGADTIFIKNAYGTEIDLGSDNDADTVHISASTLTKNLRPEDWVVFQTWEVYGGGRNIESDNPWAYTPFIPLFRLGLNDVGQLQIDGFARVLPWSNPDDYRAFIDNFDQETDAGHIHVFEYSWDSKTFKDIIASPLTATFDEAFRLVAGHMLKAATNISIYQGVDPLVLDLDGDGIELSPLSYGGELRFDMDGDGYAEPTGWVHSDDGLLVRDTNANGSIDDVSELFGDPATHGFDELATYDTNSDGIVDATEAADIRVWRDLNGNGVADTGELQTLAEAGIESLDVANTPVTETEISGNPVVAEGTFTRTDQTTGDMADVLFVIDNHFTTFTGDTTVSSTVAASGLPKMVGRGTLTDFHVALTLDETALADPGYTGPDLATVTSTQLALMTGNDLDTWREAAEDIFTAWGEASPVATIASADWWDALVAPDQTTQSTLGSRPDLHYVIDDGPTGQTVVDAVYVDWVEVEVFDEQTQQMVNEWHLAYRFASGRSIVDGNDDPIEAPTLADALATTLDTGEIWGSMSAETLAFLERYMGEPLPLGAQIQNTTALLTDITAVLTTLDSAVSALTVRLAVQGPLADTIFEGIAYDPEDDNFVATTPDGLVPVFEEIFALIPSGGGATDFVESWSRIMDFVLTDFDRGEEHLVVTPSWIFANIVAAYESVQPPVGVVDLAGAFGIDETVIRTGADAGTSGVDIFYLSAGDQVVNGGLGQDAYVVGANFGSDTIADLEAAPNGAQDTLRFASIRSTDVTATRDGNDLVISVDGTTDELRIVGQFVGVQLNLIGGANLRDDQGVEFIIFADGVVWDPAMIAAAVSTPDPTSQDITGTDATDFLDGAAGDETLTGGNGSDVYIFDVGYGSDTIVDIENLNPTYSFPDFLSLGEGLTLEDIVFTRTGTSTDLTIGIDGTTDEITIVDQFRPTYTGVFGTQWLHSIDYMAFADGSGLSAEDIAETMLERAVTDGDDTIYGFAYDDTLVGGLGNDFLSGGDGDDAYQWGSGAGDDTIEEGGLHASEGGDADTVTFTGAVASTDVTVTRNANPYDLVITIAATGETLTLQKQVDYFTLQSYRPNEIEVFRFTDVAWTASDLRSTYLTATATAGNDTITGFFTNDTLDGLAGDDQLAGGDGSDTYVFGRGSGNDTISESVRWVTYSSSDVVAFGPTVVAGDLAWSRDGASDDLTVTITDTGDTLTILGQFDAVTTSYRDIETFRFADASELSAMDIRTLLISQAATSGDETIHGFHGADVFAASAGDDTLIGYSGADQYGFGPGSGYDTIQESIAHINLDNPDVIVVDAAIGTGDLVVFGNAQDLFVTHGDGTDVIRVKGHFSQPWRDVETIRFADSTEWDLGAITIGTENTLGVVTRRGTAAAETVTGLAGDDVLDGLGGDDTLKGGAGSDTYRYGSGSGADIINETGGTVSDDDVVELVGLNASDVRFYRAAAGADADDLVIEINATAETLTVLDHFTTPTAPADRSVEKIVFADQTEWDKAAIEANIWMRGTAAGETLTGDSGNNRIFGDAGDDTLGGQGGDDIFDGGAGNDTIWGDGGSNTVLFGAGSGHDLLILTGGVDTDIDTVELVGLNADDVTLRRYDSSYWDLQIIIDATGRP